MKALGRHVLVELYDCDREKLNDLDYVREHMLEAARVSGATVVKEAFHLFNPYGVSGTVVIAESHLAIHTWPEYGYAAVDLFTCGDTVNPWLGFKYLSEKLEAGSHSATELRRGIFEEIMHTSDWDNLDKFHYKAECSSEGHQTQVSPEN